MIIKSKLYGDTIDYTWLTNQITDVFNYYNGKINVIIPASLRIRWADGSKSDSCKFSFGDTRYSGIVTIYPNVIIDSYYGDQQSIYEEIIETIIHELYHVDQFIMDWRYIQDPVYHDAIEDQVEFQAITYILSNLIDISNRFYPIKSMDYYIDKYNILSSNYVPYTRVNIIDYIAIAPISLYMVNLLPEAQHIAQVLYNTNKDVSYVINSTELIIRKDGILVNIIDYVIFMRDNVFKYDYFYFYNTDAENILLDDNDIRLIVYMNYKHAEKFMCRIID